MSKKILVLTLAFAAIFFFAGCGKKATEQAGEVTGQGSDVEQFQATLEEMAKKGKPYQCEYKLEVEGISQEGTIYFVGEEKMRGDVVIAMPDAPKSNTHFIKDGDTQYVWSDGQPQGMKMTVTKEDMEKAKEMSQQNQASVDMDTKVDLKCRKWSPDTGMLTPPSNIEFMDLSEMMKNLGNMTGGASAGETGAGAGASINADDIDMCGICNQIPAGAARDSCKQQNC